LDNGRFLGYFMKRTAFTLVELLVVIAIIGILIAILLPAVNMAREAARRSQCRNNIKQISLGLMTHIETHRYLPSGGWGYEWQCHPDRGSGLDQTGGWAYSILPFIEEKGLYTLGSGVGKDNETSTILKDGNRTRAQTPMSIWNCPTRRGLGLNTLDDGNSFYRTPKLCSTMLQAFRPDYAANGGDFRISFARGPTNLANGATYGYPDDSEINGIVFVHKLYRIRDITDGASKTYLVGEKYLNPDSYTNGLDSGDNQNIFSGDDRDIVRWAMALPQPDTPGISDSGYTFGSAHVSGWNVSMCDGSVQTLGYDIQLDTHKRLAARNDGKISGNE
jgi:prepilin-type N-terminal cleavage/methylation domain-containing protein